MEKYHLNSESLELECEHIELYPHQKKVLYCLHHREVERLKIREGFKSVKPEEFLKIFDMETLKTPHASKIVNEMYDDFLKNMKFAKSESTREAINIKLPMGAGKSYTSLALISKMPVYKNKNINIIIVPSKLIFQWKDYCANFKFNLHILHTYEKVDQFNETNFDNSDCIVVIISNTMLNRVIIPNNIFRLFVDEIDVLRNAWCGHSLMETLQDMKSVFKYITCATYSNCGYVTVSEDIINSTISLPPINHETIFLENKIYKLLLNINCDQNTISKIQLDLFEGVEELFECVFEEKVKEKNSLQIQYDKCKKEEEQTKFRSMIECKEKEINNIKNRLLTEDCIVCLDKKKNKTILLCCTIAICSDCVQKITTCVYCKKNIKEVTKCDTKTKLNTKINNICKIPVNENSKIVLIGNEHHKLDKNILNEIATKMFNSKKCLRILKGTSTVSKRILTKFKDLPELKILYFENTSMVVGFNLEYITDLILMDEIKNESLKKQIIGRFQRNGRKNVLNVYEYLYKPNL